MADISVPHAKTPITERIAGLFTRDWYKFLSLLGQAANRGFRVVDGGFATLVAGTVTVTSRYATAANGVHLTRDVTGGAVGHLSVGAIVPGTSFVINSTSATDTSTIFWTVNAPIT